VNPVDVSHDPAFGPEHFDREIHAIFETWARVELEAAGLKKQIRDVKTASSYASQNALTAHFGMGKAEKIDRLTVRRPGKVQMFEGWPADRKLVIE